MSLKHWDQAGHRQCQALVQLGWLQSLKPPDSQKCIKRYFRKNLNVVRTLSSLSHSRLAKEHFESPGKRRSRSRAADSDTLYKKLRCYPPSRTNTNVAPKLPVSASSGTATINGWRLSVGSANEITTFRTPRSRWAPPVKSPIDTEPIKAFL